jgi:hypothetical protein
VKIHRLHPSSNYRTIEIEVVPAGCDRFHAYAETSRKLCTSRTPFLTAARILLLRDGLPPETLIVMRHHGSAVIALWSTVGQAAALRVLDGSNGTPLFRPYDFRVEGRTCQPGEAFHDETIAPAPPYEEAAE